MKRSKSNLRILRHTHCFDYFQIYHTKIDSRMNSISNYLPTLHIHFLTIQVSLNSMYEQLYKIHTYNVYVLYFLFYSHLYSQTSIHMRLDCKHIMHVILLLLLFVDADLYVCIHSTVNACMYVHTCNKSNVHT